MTDYQVSRSAVLPCDLGRVHAVLDDFHRWPAWSPWEELDPDMSRTHSGDKRAGAGTMEKAIAPDMEKGLAKLATVAAGPNPIA